MLRAVCLQLHYDDQLQPDYRQLLQALKDHFACQECSRCFGALVKQQVDLVVRLQASRQVVCLAFAQLLLLVHCCTLCVRSTQLQHLANICMTASPQLVYSQADAMEISSLLCSSVTFLGSNMMRRC